MAAPDDRFHRLFGYAADFRLATGFLTRVPVPPPAAESPDLAAAGWAFPLVGAGVGAVAALTFTAAEAVGLGAWPAALLAVLASVALTGALHEDGLADTADGFGAGGDRAATLAILRDSHHGTYGTLAILFSVLLRAAAVAEIGDPLNAALALVAAHAAARGLLPAAMRALPPARADGLGADAGTPPRGVAGVAGMIAVALLLVALGPATGLVALAAAAAAVYAAARIARRRIGGYTGDVLGAFEQVAEIAILLAAAAK
jgi:adenosylcobinamide-GDP ribazoletransferase